MNNNNSNNNIVGVNAVGTIKDVFDAEDDCSEQQMKDRIEAEIVRIKEDAEKKKKEELAARRNEIRRLLQGRSVSISSLKLKCEKETQVIRHEENRMAIPEGDEDEEESEDEDDQDNNQDNDNDSSDDSMQKTTTSVYSNDSLKATNPEDSDSDSESESIDDTENENRQHERKLERRRRRNVFHRMKSRFVVRRKSQLIRC